MRDSILHRKDRLIIVAIEIIDELGIQGLSTREIAKRQDVSEATLFRHFKSKNDLLIAVLDYFSQFDADLILSTKLKGLNPKEAITYLISSTVEYYENYPAITAILQILDVLRYEAELSDRVKSIINNRIDYLKQMIEEAQGASQIRPGTDSECLAYLISGTLREMCLIWRINGQNFPLKEKTLTGLNMLLDSFGL